MKFSSVRTQMSTRTPTGSRALEVWPIRVKCFLFLPLELMRNERMCRQWIYTVLSQESTGLTFWIDCVLSCVSTEWASILGWKRLTSGQCCSCAWMNEGLLQHVALFSVVKVARESQTEVFTCGFWFPSSCGSCECWPWRGFCPFKMPEPLHDSSFFFLFFMNGQIPELHANEAGG